MKYLRDIALIYLPCLFLVGSFSWVMAYKFLPVHWTPLMLKRQIENASQDDYRRLQIWVSKEDISPLLIDAVLLAEDQRFYQHKGFDYIELRGMTHAYLQDESKIRGCSTISQQVAKNCFTFGCRSWWRKAIESYYTILIELLWSKDRILEIYLNIAETGPGLFGVEAACQEYYHLSSADISISDAAALACVLPQPLVRTPHNIFHSFAHKHAQLAKSIGKNHSMFN